MPVQNERNYNTYGVSYPNKLQYHYKYCVSAKQGLKAHLYREYSKKSQVMPFIWCLPKRAKVYLFHGAYSEIAYVFHLWRAYPKRFEI